jgi:hypothetical protein
MNNIMIQTIKIKAVHGWCGDVEGYAPVDMLNILFQVLNMFGSTRVKFSKDNLKDLQAVGFEVSLQQEALNL